MSEPYFENQLRGYNVVLGAFQALTKDICGKGMSLPVAVNRWVKMMEKFIPPNSWIIRYMILGLTVNPL